MDNLDIAIIKSSFENLDKLTDRIYFESIRNGYHHLTTETKAGIQQSLFLFNGLKNKEFIKTMMDGYEYLNEANVYFGKVRKLEEYVADEYTNKPTRIKVFVDNGEVFDIPQIAKEHLQIEINNE